MTERDPAADEKATKAPSSCIQGSWTEMITNRTVFLSGWAQGALFDDAVTEKSRIKAQVYDNDTREGNAKWGHSALNGPWRSPNSVLPIKVMKRNKCIQQVL